MQRSAPVGEVGRHLANVAAVLGDKDVAFYWLQVAYNQHEGSLIPLKIVPYYDPLRSDRRFTSLLQHIGLNSAHKPD